MRTLALFTSLLLHSAITLKAQGQQDLPYGRNLLQDPGAELSFTVENDPWWFAPEHEGQPYGLKRVPYGGTDSVFSASWGTAHGHGAHYFEYNSAVARPILSRAQVVDISQFADSIDKGRVVLRMGVQMASVNSRDYHGRMVAYYLNEKDEEIGVLRTQDIKRMHVMDKAWRYFPATGASDVPKGARRLVVMLELWNDAPDMPGVLALDDLYVKLAPFQ
ncbi:MAG: hypothetical protein JNM31_01100 [Flavobacteriales bacterium]|nr:hypothetical protein [Flavobacteriales bacterium]